MEEFPIFGISISREFLCVTLILTQLWDSKRLWWQLFGVGWSDKWRQRSDWSPQAVAEEQEEIRIHAGRHKTVTEKLWPHRFGHKSILSTLALGTWLYSTQLSNLYECWTQSVKVLAIPWERDHQYPTTYVSFKSASLYFAFHTYPSLF